tara:strand:- start:2832 stop:3377 length:546 start_codon:yes stop_codon:yes gene_type:complete
MNVNKYYQILGLEKGASKEEIERKYKQLSEELSPENNDNQDFFKEEYAKVQEAYRVLIKEAILIKNTNKSNPNSINEKKEKESVRDKTKDLKPIKKNKMHFVDKIKLILGYLFIAFSIFALYLAFCYQINCHKIIFNGSVAQKISNVFGPYDEGSASNLPFFYGLMGLAGAILLASVKYEK